MSKVHPVDAQEPPEPPERLPVDHGGLMRCCLVTIRDFKGRELEGTVLPCKWCDSSMIVRAGCWKWNYPGGSGIEPCEASPSLAERSNVSEKSKGEQA